MPFTIGSGDLGELDGKPVGFTVFDDDDHLDAMVAGLARGIPDFGNFFAPAFMDVFDAAELRNLTYSFGRSDPSSDLHPGSLALLNGHWLIILAAQGREISSALTLSFSGDEPVFTTETLKGGPAGGPTSVWTPTSERVLRDDTQIGAFWGPVLTRYRHLLTARPGNILDLLDTIFPSVRYDTSSFSALLEAIGHELYPWADDLPLWPGAVLLTERDEEIGVSLPDRTVLGIREDSLDNFAAHMSLSEFRPAYVWYPHL
uniref:hypothetical protein n=1 Tax=Sphingomonas bacterium TaxID=1895847 RepID=UPI0026349449|nr:hypothetical protein [Sphingomonas bacterium]